MVAFPFSVVVNIFTRPQLSPQLVQTEWEMKMTKLIVGARGEQDAANWLEVLKEYGKRWNLTEQCMTEVLLFYWGIFLVKSILLMVDEDEGNEVES